MASPFNRLPTETVIPPMASPFDRLPIETVEHIAAWTKCASLKALLQLRMVSRRILGVIDTVKGDALYVAVAGYHLALYSEFNALDLAYYEQVIKETRPFQAGDDASRIEFLPLQRDLALRIVLTVDNNVELPQSTYELVRANYSRLVSLYIMVGSPQTIRPPRWLFSGYCPVLRILNVSMPTGNAEFDNTLFKDVSSKTSLAQLELYGVDLPGRPSPVPKQVEHLTFCTDGFWRQIPLLRSHFHTRKLVLDLTFEKSASLPPERWASFPTVKRPTQIAWSPADIHWLSSLDSVTVILSGGYQLEQMDLLFEDFNGRSLNVHIHYEIDIHYEIECPTVRALPIGLKYWSSASAPCEVRLVHDDEIFSVQLVNRHKSYTLHMQMMIPSVPAVIARALRPLANNIHSLALTLNNVPNVGVVWPTLPAVEHICIMLTGDDATNGAPINIKAPQLKGIYVRNCTNIVPLDVTFDILRPLRESFQKMAMKTAISFAGVGMTDEDFDLLSKSFAMNKTEILFFKGADIPRHMIVFEEPMYFPWA